MVRLEKNVFSLQRSMICLINSSSQEASVCVCVFCADNQSEKSKGRVCYLLIASLQLHMFELPEAAHRLHLLQVSVEGQSAQTKAVAAVADGLQPLHLLNDGRHGYRWRYR